MRWLLPIGVFILACAGNPESDAAQAYVATMHPILVENAALAQRFLTEASRVKKKETDGAQLAELLTKELAPKAEALAAEAKAVAPGDPKLDDAHALLVKAWAARATAYGGMKDAWAHGDLAAWDAAMKANTQAKLDEEAYFARVGAVLAPYDLTVDPYPAQ